MFLLAVGPEAGFSEREETAMDAAGFERVHLGPRVLRTETVAPALLAAKSLARACGGVLYAAGVHRVLAGLSVLYLFAPIVPWLHVFAAL